MNLKKKSNNISVFIIMEMQYTMIKKIVNKTVLHLYVVTIVQLLTDCLINVLFKEKECTHFSLLHLYELAFENDLFLQQTQNISFLLFHG